MYKRCIALLMSLTLLLSFAACNNTDKSSETENQNTESNNDIAAASGRENEEELINDVFRHIKNKDEYSEVADCFDKYLTTAYCLAEDISYSDSFDDYYSIAKDFESGADYITQTYPEFAEAFEKDAGKPLVELYDEALNRYQSIYSSIEKSYNEIKNGNELLWDGFDKKDVFDEDLGIKQYEIQIDYDYDRDGSSAIVGANLYYIELNGRYYGLLLNETIGGGKGA